MYVGETEKQIKAVFDNYRHSVNAASIAPILFFNEADAVMGRRIEFTNSSRAVDRMENTLQNIILQELENLDGILIATTNLTTNLDKAFERRFLYRIEFEKPNLAARVSIWRTMLPDLPAGEAENLAGRFEISGGQIENAARKYTVNTVLRGLRPSPEALAGFCRDEMRGKNETGFKIGFSA
jgi:SpoVK/Ycf46/Vps4 family AAA+-type ATPase